MNIDRLLSLKSENQFQGEKQVMHKLKTNSTGWIDIESK